MTSSDRVIFLGDYVDGFEDYDFETLQWLMDARQQNKNIIVLRGNTDDGFLDDLEYLLDYQGHKEYEKYCKFIEGLPYYHQEIVGKRKIIFCHGGISSDENLIKQPKSRFLSGGSFYSDYEGDALVVVGHKAPKKVYKDFPKLFNNEPVDNTKPVKIPNKNILLMDTRAKDEEKEGGVLSAVDVLTGELWQNDSDLDYHT